jgi:L-ectoine synthase
MIVRRLEKVNDSERDIHGTVNGQPWRSRRLLLKRDNMGFSFHITTIPSGSEHYYEYKSHLESVYCITGEGSVEDLATGIQHDVSPGTLYALDKHDRHCLRAKTEMTFACVFQPALIGDEKHDPDGSYLIR